MSCNCNRDNRVVIKKEITAGDTFSITYKHKQDGEIADMPEAYDLVIGLFDQNGARIAAYKYQDGDISNPETGVYKWTISHEASVALPDLVVIKMTIYSADLSFVQHCNQVVYVTVLRTEMNDELTT